MYKFIFMSLIWLLMVGLGILYIFFEDVVKIVILGYVVVCVVVVIVMVVMGYFVGKMMKMYLVDVVIVIGCYSGLGGMGDVVILLVFNCMLFMLFV